MELDDGTINSGDRDDFDELGWPVPAFTDAYFFLLRPPVDLVVGREAYYHRIAGASYFRKLDASFRMSDRGFIRPGTRQLPVGPDYDGSQTSADKCGPEESR